MSPQPLTPPTVIRTGHDQSGKAIISDRLPEQPTAQVVSNGDASFYLAYTTEEFPVDMNQDKDLAVYQKYASQPPGLVVSGGTVLRYVDMAPGITSPMHRTVSMDYGIVIHGEIELVLDSGETRLMKPGDVCVQRGTMHAWRNTSTTSYARMLYVLLPSKALTVGEQTLGEDYGGTMDAFRVFDNIVVLTDGAQDTSSVSVLAYNNLIKGLNLGIGSTMSVLIFLAVALIAFLFVKLFGAAAPGADEDGGRR